MRIAQGSSTVLTRFVHKHQHQGHLHTSQSERHSKCEFTNDLKGEVLEQVVSAEVLDQPIERFPLKGEVPEQVLSAEVLDQAIKRFPLLLKLDIMRFCLWEAFVLLEKSHFLWMSYTIAVDDQQKRLKTPGERLLWVIGSQPSSAHVAFDAAGEGRKQVIFTLKVVVNDACTGSSTFGNQRHRCMLDAMFRNEFQCRL